MSVGLAQQWDMARQIIYLYFYRELEIRVETLKGLEVDA